MTHKGLRLKCRNCGKRIKFIHTPSGKNRPVDDVLPIDYDDAPDGMILVTNDGRSHVVQKRFAYPNVRAFPCHFQSCRPSLS